MSEAEKWARELANSEAEAFEQAMTRIKPEQDELQQAWRQGFIEGKKSQDKRIIEIAKHYGALIQREQFIEECSEAILAAQKCKRYGSNGSFKALCSEVADVLVMAQQMRLLMGAKVIDEIIDKKLNRQLGRIANES